MKQHIRIESNFGPFGTKVFNREGAPLLDKITSIEFTHRVGDVPRLEVQAYATETVIEGEMEVRRVVICPCCKKELEQELAAGATEVAVADATGFADECVQFVPAPHK